MVAKKTANYRENNGLGKLAREMTLLPGLHLSLCLLITGARATTTLRDGLPASKTVLESTVHQFD